MTLNVETNQTDVLQMNGLYWLVPDGSNMEECQQAFLERSGSSWILNNGLVAEWVLQVGKRVHKMELKKAFYRFSERMTNRLGRVEPYI